MTRPKRAALKRRLTELYVRKLKPKAQPFLVWDTHQRGLAIRVQPTGRGPGSASTPTTAGRAGCTSATPAPSGSPTPARWRPRRCSRSPRQGPGRREAGRARRRHFRRAGRALRRALCQAPEQELGAGRQAHPPPPLPRWGKLQAASITRADVRAMMAGSRRQCWPTKSWRPPARSSRGPSSRRSSRPTRAAVSTATRPGAASASCPTREVPQFWSAFDAAGLVVSSALKMILLTGQRPGEVRHMRREHIVDGWWEMPESPCPSSAGPAPRTVRAIACGCPRRRRRCWPSWR